MKTLLLGGNGKLGKKLQSELIKKDIQVVNFSGDARDFNLLKEESNNIDVIASTVGAKTVEDLLKIAENVIKIAKENNCRVVWSGGAATLLDKDGKRLFDIPQDDFPQEMKDWIPAVYGHGQVLEMFKQSDIDWTFMSPALNFVDEESKVFTFLSEATDKALYNNKGESYATYSAGAQALANEIEDQKYSRKRFTIVQD